MDKWLKVKDVAKVLGCSIDTARNRMTEMAEVINVGTPQRQQLMVPEYALEDWMRNHRLNHVRVIVPTGRSRKDGKIARRDRRTGELKVI